MPRSNGAPARKGTIARRVGVDDEQPVGTTAEWPTSLSGRDVWKTSYAYARKTKIARAHDVTYGHPGIGTLRFRESVPPRAYLVCRARRSGRALSLSLLRQGKYVCMDDDRLSTVHRFVEWSRLVTGFSRCSPDSGQLVETEFPVAGILCDSAAFHRAPQSPTVSLPPVTHENAPGRAIVPVPLRCPGLASSGAPAGQGRAFPAAHVGVSRPPLAAGDRVYRWGRWPRCYRRGPLVGISGSSRILRERLTGR